eukprot:scaffold7464_cov136-Isochrysis_galbana.AAC.3
MPRIRIGAFYTSGNDTGVALRQEGNEVALQVYKTADGAGTPTSTTPWCGRHARGPASQWRGVTGPSRSTPWGRALGTAPRPLQWNGRDRFEDWAVEG